MSPCGSFALWVAGTVREPSSGGALARFRSSGGPIRVGAHPMPLGGPRPADGSPRPADGGPRPANGRPVPAGVASGPGDLSGAQGGRTLHRNPLVSIVAP